MYIRTDDEHNILEVIVVGGKPTTNGYEVDTIDESILSDLFSYKYIDGNFVKNDKNPLDDIIDDVKRIKLNMMSSVCQTIIENGIDIGNDHYSLSSNDQINIMKLESQARLNMDQSFPYHADGQLCRLYTAEEIIGIASAATSWVLYWTTYYNHLKSEVVAMTTSDEVINVKFGQALSDASMESFKMIVGDTVISIDPIEDGFDYNSLLLKPNTSEIINTDQAVKDAIAEAEAYEKELAEIDEICKPVDDVIDTDSDNQNDDLIIEGTSEDMEMNINDEESDTISE